MSLTFTDAATTTSRVGAAKTKFYIGTTATDPSGDTYTEVRGVTGLPDFGFGVADDVTRDEIGDAVQKHAKGMIKAGGGALKFTYYPGDVGQDALKVAAQDFSGVDYNFAIVLPNKVSSRGTTFFHKGVARGFNIDAVTGPNNIYGGTCDINFNTVATVVAAS